MTFIKFACNDGAHDLSARTRLRACAQATAARLAALVALVAHFTLGAGTAAAPRLPGRTRAPARLAA
ncbi:hypothetical protein [Pseudoduganella chitinolytica]|uniref:Uncharacterized protein n=1 Tax=Pseudoduganella chitinolytica TaxID=34070 RepID=A0ABY8BLM3_9BURK|nr:hypothetical protein [Pseudoduganella chitinolytica]WEF35269.1 hypothetical protein PX653_11080 [Pseudoduganella chitinolytica]